MKSVNSLIDIIQKISPNSCPKYINLHCHTTFSDGSLTPEQLIKQAADLGLTDIAITDHHTISSYEIIANWLNNNHMHYNYVPRIWSGVEISCLLKRCLVHVLALDFEINNPSITPYLKGEACVGSYLNADSVVKSIHEANGLAILAHPARYRLNYKELIEESHNLNFDGGEAWYDYEFVNPWRPSPLICESIDRQLKSLNMLSTCGTDTHGLSLISR